MIRANRFGLGSGVARLALVAAMAVPVAAQAQDDTGDDAPAEEARRSQIETVVVTARKREESLLDFPGSAAVLGSAQLEDIGGIRDLRELTDQIVGLTITEALSSDLAEPSIRGAGQSRNRTSVSATGLYRNGAYFASNGLGGRNFARFDSFDLERAEILRGPQGALYGRNSLGGTINLITQKPTDEFELDATVGAGSKERLLLEGIVNVPLTDQIATRFSAVYDEQNDGFFTAADGSPLDNYDYEHYRGGIRIDFTENLLGYYSFDYSDENNPVVLRNRDSLIEERQANGEDVDEFDLLVNTPHFFDHEIVNHFLEFNWDLGNGTVTSITNYRDRELIREEDRDFSGPDIRRATRLLGTVTVNETDVFFQELRYVSDYEGPFQWLIGADIYKLEVSEDLNQTSNGLIQGTKIDCSNLNANTTACRDIDIEQDSWAIYASADYAFDFVPVTLSGEVRYAFDEINGDVLVISRAQAEPILDFVGGNEFTNVPWGVTAAWRTEKGQIYGKVATSYRHGGINLNASLPSDAFQSKPVYDEETAITYEVGYKRSLFGMMDLAAAAYFVEYEDFLDTTTNGCPDLCPFLDADDNTPLGFDADGNPITVDADGNPGIESPTVFFIENVGTAEAFGFEVELTGNLVIEPTDGTLRFGVGVASQDGEVTEIADDVSDSNLESLGVRLPRLRDLQVSANATYRQPFDLGYALFDEASYFLTGVVTYEDGGVQNLSATNAQELDSFTRIDLRTGIDTRHWSLIGSIDNLTDEIYALNRQTAGRFNPSLPRRYLIEFSYRH